MGCHGPVGVVEEKTMKVPPIDVCSMSRSPLGYPATDTFTGIHEVLPSVTAGRAT